MGVGMVRTESGWGKVLIGAGALTARLLLGMMQASPVHKQGIPLPPPTIPQSLLPVLTLHLPPSHTLVAGSQ